MMPSQSSPKPYLFLDVDGVLNRIPDKKRKDSGEWGDFKKFVLRPFSRENKYNLFFSQKMANALKALPVQIVWLTTWTEEAPRLVAPCIQFPKYPVAGFGSDMTGRKTSKLGCVLEWLEAHGEEGHPFIWIDDDAIPMSAEDDFTYMGHEVLIIRPNPHEGITEFNIEEIKAFCGAL